MKIMPYFIIVLTRTVKIKELRWKDRKRIKEQFCTRALRVIEKISGKVDDMLQKKSAIFVNIFSANFGQFL